MISFFLCQLYANFLPPLPTLRSVQTAVIGVWIAATCVFGLPGGQYKTIGNNITWVPDLGNDLSYYPTFHRTDFPPCVYDKLCFNGTADSFTPGCIPRLESELLTNQGNPNCDKHPTSGATALSKASPFTLLLLPFLL